MDGLHLYSFFGGVGFFWFVLLLGLGSSSASDYFFLLEGVYEWGPRRVSILHLGSGVLVLHRGLRYSGPIFFLRLYYHSHTLKCLRLASVRALSRSLYYYGRWF